MRYNRLCSTGPIVSGLCLGTMAFGTGAEAELTQGEMEELAKLGALPREYPGRMFAVQGACRRKKVSPRRAPA